MSDLKAFGWSVVVALNAIVAVALILWLSLGAFGLFLLLGTWPLVGAAAFFTTWLCCPSPGEKRGNPGVRGHP